MARVFVFSSYFCKCIPTLEEFVQTLPLGTKVIAYNLNENDMKPYFMVAFDNTDDTYHQWCHDKENDIPIILALDGKWHMQS